MPDEDSVSLRELYLVLRAGLPLVVLLALLAGAAATAYVGLRPTTYTASAVVQVLRPRVSSAPGSGLEVAVAPALDVDGYTRLAEDRSTMESVMAELGVAAVRDLGELTAVPGPGARSAESFAVTHEVTAAGSDGAERAARTANAWATATASAARDLLVAPWALAGRRVTEDVDEREEAYRAATEAWADFARIDERTELRRRLESLVELEAARLLRLGELEAAVAGKRARAASAGASQRETLEAEVVELEAEADAVRADLAAGEDRSAELRTRLGELERQAAELQRAVSATSLDYFRASPAEASIQLQEALAAGSVSVALPATPPFSPDPRNLVATAIGAMLVGGLVGTLLVFVRAAIREPARLPVTTRTEPTVTSAP